MSATRDGIILGTAAYMSPEQARGKPVDKRSDIWAFGCVLYEMLTGRKAFDRETVSDTMAAILEREPDWRGSRPATPAASAVCCGDVSKRMSAGVFATSAMRVSSSTTQSADSRSRSLHRTSSRCSGGSAGWPRAVVGIVAVSIALIAGLFWRTWARRPAPPRAPAADLHADHVAIRTRVVSQPVA